jgi:trk system potassium uptake protein TrkH
VARWDENAREKSACSPPSMGITADLTTWGKIIITLMMVVGRVGILTFSYIIVGTVATKGVEYSEENLMIG